MVWSPGAYWSRETLDRLQGARQIFRDVRPLLAIIAGFAAVALLIDFCFACLFQALR